MADQLAKGKIIDSFSEGFKAMKYEQFKVEREKSKVVKKKENGGRVMGGSGGSTGSYKSNVREALPAGTTMDQILEKYTNSL